MHTTEEQQLNCPHRFDRMGMQLRDFRRVATNTSVECKESFDNIFTPKPNATHNKRVVQVGTMDDLFRTPDWSLEHVAPLQFGSVERFAATPGAFQFQPALIKKPNTRAFAELVGRGLKDRLVGWKERSKGSVVQVANNIQAPRVSVKAVDCASFRQSILSRPSISRPVTNKQTTSQFADLITPITVTDEAPDSGSRRKSGSKSPKRKFMIRVMDSSEAPTHRRQRSVFVDSKKRMSKSPESSMVKISDSQMLSQVNQTTDTKKQGRFSVFKKSVETRRTQTIAQSVPFVMGDRQEQVVQPLHSNLHRIMTSSAFVSPHESPLHTKRASRDPTTATKRTISILASGLEPVGFTNRRLSRKNC